MGEVLKQQRLSIDFGEVGELEDGGKCRTGDQKSGRDRSGEIAALDTT